MSYTLGLLFEYYRYRHDAIVRVYADDCLVDELSLSSDINMKCTNNVDPLVNRFIGPTNGPTVVPPVIPEKLFLFEIDERHLCNRIRIEVQNDDTNYNARTDYSPGYDLLAVLKLCVKFSLAFFIGHF